MEALIHTKMAQKEFIILCLEDCSDWSNATTRRVVMQVPLPLLNKHMSLCATTLVAIIPSSPYVSAICSLHLCTSPRAKILLQLS